MNTNCNATCKSIGSTFECIPTYNPSKIPVEDPVRDPNNATNYVDVDCFQTEQKVWSNYTKPTHPSYDVTTGLCEGHSDVPYAIDCFEKSGPNERRLCFCANEGRK